MAKPQSKPNWKLRAPDDTQAQGIVVSGFDTQPAAQALFLFFDWPENGPDGPHTAGKGAWLRALNNVAQITNADGQDPRSAVIAFTFTGIQKLGLSSDALGTFSAPFREGMYQEDRLRRIGDRIDGQWQQTVISGGPRWSANIPPQKLEAKENGVRPLREVGAPPERPEAQAPTPITVHALLLLYGTDEDEVQQWSQAVAGVIASHGVKIVHRLPLWRQSAAAGIAREHFGFADGLSQPIPYGAEGGGITDDIGSVLLEGRPAARDPWHGVPLGEILLGHIDSHHERAPGPVVPDEALAKEQDLPQTGAPEGFRNLGFNGSYMVVRELRQNVAAFWNSLEKGAASIRATSPNANQITAQWLAERIIGRSINGHLLCPAGQLPPDQYGLPENAFGFKQTDPYGLGCPVGAHVRRANPRDALAKDVASAQTLLDAANNHRILRRGRTFGKPPADRYVADDVERGLLFICLNTDITRQFEFVQQNWVLNRNFATLFDETDPLVGPKGDFTIPEEPLRRIVEVETFVQSAGGEYFFLPSLPAFNYLASL
jgi:Dyp-type peroxidase family